MAEFFAATPGLVQRIARAAGRRAEAEQRGRAWLAWHSAAFQRSKRMPPLAKVLGVHRSAPPRQTPAQMQAIARQWAVATAPRPKPTPASSRVRGRLADRR